MPKGMYVRTEAMRKVMSERRRGVLRRPRHKCAQSTCGTQTLQVFCSISCSKKGNKNSLGKKRLDNVERNRRPVQQGGMLGRKQSIAEREVRSKANKGNPSLVESGLRSKNAWKHYKYLDQHGQLHDFKSSWELHLAEFFDAQDLTWRYEPVVLLSDGQKWKPDFWVAEYSCYYEVKGPYDRSKYEQALLDGKDIVLVDSDPKAVLR